MSSREYPSRPLVGIGIVLLKPGFVLLVKRGKAPAAGTWSLPGGAQEVGEPAETTARRELMEETGLAVGGLSLVCHVDSIHRDAAGVVQYHYTILDFTGVWIGGEPVAGSDVTAAEFAPLDGLDAYDLWSEARRVIGLARQIVSFGGDATAMLCRD